MSAGRLNHSTLIYFYLSVVWPLPRLTHSLSNLVMSCKVTSLPSRLGGWSIGGIPGISIPVCLYWVRWTILYTHPNHVTPPPPCPPPQTHGETKALLSAPWHCPLRPPCSWVSWDARNNWWQCRPWYLPRQGSRHFLPPPAEGYCPATSICTNWFQRTADLPFHVCH